MIQIYFLPEKIAFQIEVTAETSHPLFLPVYFLSLRITLSDTTYLPIFDFCIHPGQGDPLSGVTSTLD